jgi:DNA polymerase I
MKGFFSAEEMGKPDFCDECGLFRTCKTPKMSYTGNGERKTLIIAEAPGEEEDLQGIQLIGQAGQLLRNCLKKFKLDLDHDFWKINSVNCRPPKNRKPSKKEIQFCKPNVDKVIEELKPKFIWLMGGVALDSFFMGIFSGEQSISKWRKYLIPFHKNNCWVIPMYHPSYVNRNKDPKLQTIFESDLQYAASCLNLFRPEKIDYNSKVKKLTNFSELTEELMRLNNAELMFFDYETSHLNPYKGNQKIWSVSFATNSNEAFAFPLHYPNAWDEVELFAIEELWKTILQNPDVKKISHHMKFEDKWGRGVLKTKTEGWDWCTMTTQHILDDRAETTGLKFQAFVRWGVLDYEKGIQKYLTTDNATGYNSMFRAPISELLHYGALDSLFGFKLLEEQKDEIKRQKILQKGNALFLQGLRTLCDVEENGIGADSEYYFREDKRLENQIYKLERDIRNCPESRIFKNHTGRDIDLKSTKDLNLLLYDLLALVPTKLTDKGSNSVDAEALNLIQTDFTRNLVAYRKLLKTKDTYLAQFMREICPDSRIHPTFNLHFARTFRSSSDSPNFQNIPVRNKEAKKSCRSGLIPTKGNQIVEIDFSSLEVRIIACHSHDPELMAYIYDPKTDMHRDQAIEIYQLPADEITGDLRFHSKNSVVFAFFYGSYYKPCAEGVWESIKGLKTRSGVDIYKHLKSKNLDYFKPAMMVDDPSPFEKHMQRVENKFWTRFKATKEWQEDLEQFYIRHGYVELITGFKRGGYLRRNQIVNTPIQGSAFHCLLWSLIELNKELKKHKMESKIVGQIHDSIVLDVRPIELKEIMNYARDIMTKRIREVWDWIIVPLDIEIEITPINGAWIEKEEYKED